MVEEKNVEECEREERVIIIIMKGQSGLRRETMQDRANKGTIYAAARSIDRIDVCPIHLGND